MQINLIECPINVKEIIKLNPTWIKCVGFNQLHNKQGLRTSFDTALRNPISHPYIPICLNYYAEESYHLRSITNSAITRIINCLLYVIGTAAVTIQEDMCYFLKTSSKSPQTMGEVDFTKLETTQSSKKLFVLVSTDFTSIVSKFQNGLPTHANPVLSPCFCWQL